MTLLGRKLPSWRRGSEAVSAGSAPSLHQLSAGPQVCGTWAVDVSASAAAALSVRGFAGSRNTCSRGPPPRATPRPVGERTLETAVADHEQPNRRWRWQGPDCLVGRARHIWLGGRRGARRVGSLLQEGHRARDVRRPRTEKAALACACLGSRDRARPEEPVVSVFGDRRPAGCGGGDAVGSRVGSCRAP